MKKSSRELKDRVTAIIEANESSSLITVSDKGCPRARVLEDHNPHPGFVFWFATHSATRKVSEIQNCPEVSVYYLVPEGAGYICILGTAEIRTDPESREYLWRDSWREYWPEGPDSKEYVPIRITPAEIEYYNSGEGALADDGYAPLFLAPGDFAGDD